MANPESSKGAPDASGENVYEKTVDQIPDDDTGPTPEQQNATNVINDMERDVYGPALKDAAVGYLNQLSGPSRGRYDRVIENKDSLSMGQFLEAAGEAYVEKHPELLDKMKTGEISLADMFASLMGELSGSGPLKQYDRDIQKKIAELYAMNSGDFDKLTSIYQEEELEHMLERAKWVKEQRLRAPKAVHQQKVQEAAAAFRDTEKAWKNVQDKKSALELVLMTCGYQSNEVEERKDYHFDDKGSLVMTGEPRRSIAFETKESQEKRTAAIREAEKAYNDARTEYREASEKADALAKEEETSYQAVEKISKEEDANIAKIEQKLAEKRAEKGKKK